MIKLSTMLAIMISSFGFSEDYDRTREEISAAIGKGNFTEVKSLLKDLMPELKENLKEGKVAFNTIKKTNGEEEVEILKERLARKKEIYHSLDHLLHVSPAAVRARASAIVKMLDEYNDLEIST